MSGRSAEFERQKPITFILAQRLALPLYSHKKQSDEAGKHENWSPFAHRLAEIGAIGLDIGVDCLAGIYLLCVQQQVEAAVGAKILYQAGVELVPDKIALIGKGLSLNVQALKSKGKLL